MHLGYQAPFNKQESRQNVSGVAVSEPATVPIPEIPKVPPIEEKTVEPVEEATPVAPVETPEPVVAERPPVATVTGTNEAMQFIFAHESSNNPLAIAPNGACGLGQAWPCSKLLAVCGSLANVDCQIQFFTDYANSKYGGWSGAYAFWQQNHWW